MKENLQPEGRVVQDRSETGRRVQTVYDGTVIGYKRIAPLAPLVTDKIRIRILDSRVAPTLSFIGVY